MIEVKNFLAKMKIFQHRRPAGADLQRVLVVRHRCALLSGQYRGTVIGGLVGFAAGADGYGLIAILLRALRAIRLSFTATTFFCHYKYPSFYIAVNQFYADGIAHPGRGA